MKWKERFNYLWKLILSFFIQFKIGKVSYDKCGDDRKKNTTIPLNQDGRSVQVVTRKLDLDQTSMAHTHTERHIRDQTRFSVANFSLDDSVDICDPE